LARNGDPLGDRTLRRLGSEHLGAAGYLISRAGARKMLALTRPLAECADQTMFGRAAVLEDRVVAYQLDPAIVVQDNVHPDARARLGIVTTLHESDRARLAEAARRAKPRGLARLKREAERLIQQARQTLWFFPSMQRARVSWR
jgi:glycosyl transferase family 25